MITTIFHYCIFRITGANSPEKVDFETYASIDDELIIADRPTEDDIVASIINWNIFSGTVDFDDSLR
jgi:hypothetical protein